MKLKTLSDIEKLPSDIKLAVIVAGMQQNFNEYIEEMDGVMTDTIHKELYTKWMDLKKELLKHIK